MQTETRYPVKESFRGEREASDQIRRIAKAEQRPVGSVLRRLVAKALKTEKIK